MHYYQHHIGDFIRDTASLTDSQGMAYLRLIWMYYSKEEPLPNNPRVLAFKIGSDDETVSLILEAFFSLAGDVYRHKRCDSELAEYAVIRDRNAANGRLGGRPKKSQQATTDLTGGFSEQPNGNPDEPNGNPEKPSGFPVGSQSEPSRNPNQEPVTSNQEEEKKKTSSSKSAEARFSPLGFLVKEGASQKIAKDWLAVRSQKRLASTETALAGVVQEVNKSGKTIDEVLTVCCQKGWAGFEAAWLKSQRSSSTRVDDDVFAGCI